MTPVLREFFEAHPRVFVLTGAGCSTASGIPDYRDRDGTAKNRAPVTYQDFVSKESARRRYWARSVVGWARVGSAVPNRAHRALASLERVGVVTRLVTQNVDGLHQKAGSERVIDLHGRLERVMCVACGARTSRAEIQERLVAANPEWSRFDAPLPVDAAPDGDAKLEGPFDDFEIPACDACGGVLKPDVVFFGENVPKPRVDDAYQALADSDALLAIGTSLMVFSGYRFCLAARESKKPVAIVNRGVTRADDFAALKLDADCCDALD